MPAELDLDLEVMQWLVGGRIEVVEIAPGLDLICDEEGVQGGRPANRRIPMPSPYEGEEGWELVIFGDFFLVRHDGKGGHVSVTEEDVQKYKALLDKWMLPPGFEL